MSFSVKTLACSLSHAQGLPVSMHVYGSKSSKVGGSGSSAVSDAKNRQQEIIQDGFRENIVPCVSIKYYLADSQ